MTAQSPHFVFRGRELLLLLFPFALTALGFWVLQIVPNEAARGVRIWPAGALIGAGLVAHLLLSYFTPDADQTLLPIALTLTGMGLIMIERLADPFTVRQTASFLIGMVFCLGLAVWPRTLSVLERYRYILLVPGLLLLLVTIVLTLGSGLTLFLRIGSFGVQPSEILKLLMIIFLAGYLDFHREKFTAFRLTNPLADQRMAWVYFPMLGMWGLSMILLFTQRDLGAALLFFGIFLSMAYLATQRGDYVMLGLGLFVVGAWVAGSLVSRVQDRVTIWLNPWDSDVGYQIVQGLLAIANGGLLGQGLGQGYPHFVPVVHSDFILVAIAEEWGLAGVLAVVGLFLIMLLKGFTLALRGKDSYRQLLAGGLNTLVCFQAFIIMAGTLRLMPLTGITLPFVSYGGSSIMTMYAMLGLLLRLSQEAEQEGGG